MRDGPTLARVARKFSPAAGSDAIANATSPSLSSADRSIALSKGLSCNQLGCSIEVDWVDCAKEHKKGRISGEILCYLDGVS